MPDVLDQVQLVLGEVGAVLLVEHLQDPVGLAVGLDWRDRHLLLAAQGMIRPDQGGDGFGVADLDPS
ncbi:hypothetical protein D3C87_2168640 [compost metagenome]